MTILDLLSQRGLQPRRVAGTHGGEYACACPGCGGRDRFHAWPEQQGKGCPGGTWYCRGCRKGGDCIQFLREFEGMGYREACAALRLPAATGPRSLSMPREARREREAFAPRQSLIRPSTLWQEHAGKLLEQARANLAQCVPALQALERRGITAEDAAAFGLGWLPGENGRDGCFRSRKGWGLPEVTGPNGKPRALWIPAGLVIPALDEDGAVLRLRIRRTNRARQKFEPAMKYVVVPGSSMHPLLLRPQCRALVVVESEMDAMACAAAAQRTGLDVGALAVGTNVGKPDVTAHAACARALCILVALDFDAPDANGSRPGARGWEFWARTYQTARRWPVPVGKDPGEAYAAGLDLAAWLRAGLPPVFSRVASSLAPAPAQEAAQGGQEVPLPVPGRPGAGTERAAAVQDHAAKNFEEILGAGGRGARQGMPAKSARPARALRPADALRFRPIGPRDALRLLAQAGLRVEPCDSPEGRDFRVYGHERWNGEDFPRLTAWLKRWGADVRAALGLG
ncbi:MAG: DNA primase [Desulfovibrio desulfuricans]|nr:DNA primase [Desulfovibrio desulfuricans]